MIFDKYNLPLMLTANGPNAMRDLITQNNNLNHIQSVEIMQQFLSKRIKSSDHPMDGQAPLPVKPEAQPARN